MTTPPQPPPAGRATGDASRAPSPAGAARAGARARADRQRGRSSPARREVQIDHRGALYRLKQTALGKLILTK